MAEQPLGIRTLTVDQIEQAYALVGACFPFVSLADWRRFAARLIRSGAESERPSGIVAAVNPAGRFRGTFSYWTEPRPQHERLLVVAYLAIPVFGWRRVAEVLGDQMVRIALAHRCGRIHLEVPPDCDWELAFFGARGYEVEVMRLAVAATPPHPQAR